MGYRNGNAYLQTRNGARRIDMSSAVWLGADLFGFGSHWGALGSLLKKLVFASKRGGVT
jgi:hypothetical protein